MNWIEILYAIVKVGTKGSPNWGSGHELRWNWYLTPMANFGEVRIFSDLLGSVQMLKRESGVRKTTGSYRTYSSLVKLQPGSWVCGGRPAFGKNCSLGAWVCSDLPLGRTLWWWWWWWTSYCRRITIFCGNQIIFIPGSDKFERWSKIFRCYF